MDFDRYNLTEHDSQYVAERISHYNSEAPENTKWLTPYVEKFNILPLFLGWTETIGVMIDGTVRKFSTENEYEGLKNITDRGEYIWAIVSGSDKYPKLKSLLPEKPANAIECKLCSGTGHIKGTKMACKCGGLGWIE